MIRILCCLLAGLLACAAFCADPKPGEVRVNARDGAKMVWIPAGSFMMGVSAEEVATYLKERTDFKAAWFADEQPKHQVTLDGYWMYQYEVTVGQYRKFCAQTKREMPKLPEWATDKYPMVNTTWYDAAAYAEWAGGRLPSEAEWEHAARGNDGRRFPWGNDWQGEQCNNFSDNNVAGGGAQGNKATPGGSYPNSASPYGVEDMAGNVWEWCQDWYAADYYKISPQRNPMGPKTGELRVLRGGSWGSTSKTIRSSNRHADAPDLTYHDDGGFRCVVPTATLP